MSNFPAQAHPSLMLAVSISNGVDRLLNMAQVLHRDRKTAQDFLFLLGVIDAQLCNHRHLMSWTNENQEKMDYFITMKIIRPKLESAEDFVYEKNYKPFKEAARIWMELLASSYPYLGLVPEIKKTFYPAGMEGVETSVAEEDELNDDT